MESANSEKFNEVFTEAEFQKLLSEFTSQWCGAGTYNIAYDYREGSANNKYRPYGDETQFEGESSEELCQLFFDFLREDRVCLNDIIDVYIYKVSEEIHRKALLKLVFDVTS